VVNYVTGIIKFSIINCSWKSHDVDTLKQIRGIDPNVIVIVISGYSNDPIMSYYKFDFNEIVVKPFRVVD
jgi:hypothetical protein